MATTIEMTLSVQKALFDQAESVAQQLGISPTHLFELAVADFIKPYQAQALTDAVNPGQLGRAPSAIKQGDIYWLQVAEPDRTAAGYPHPHVVIQDDAINGSRITTVVVCALTSNLKRGTEPGNVLLDVGEANLSRQSIIVVSQVETVDKTQLGDYIGSLSKPRIEQILAGMRFQQAAFFARYQAH